MRKKNSANIVLFAGVILSFICFTILKSMILGLVAFIGTFAIVLYKQRGSFWASSAVSNYRRGNVERSFALYEKAIQVNDCSDMVKITYAYRLITEGNQEACNNILKSLDYNQMTAVEKLNYNATNALNIWKQGGLGRAIEMYEALLNEKDSVLMYETLGYLLNLTNNHQKALEFNQKAVAAHGNNERIQNNLATSYCQAGQEKEAVKIYKQLIEDYATFPEPYYHYGCILESCEKYKGAIKYWNMALEKKFAPIYTLTEEAVQNKIDKVTERMA